jgi:hypothetical protein
VERTLVVALEAVTRPVVDPDQADRVILAETPLIKADRENLGLLWEE